MRLKQRKFQVYEFICYRLASTGEAPTLAEIGRRFDLKSSATVHSILRALEVDGLIKRSRNWRGIEIVDQTQDQSRVTDALVGVRSSRDVVAERGLAATRRRPLKVGQGQRPRHSNARDGKRVFSNRS